MKRLLLALMLLLASCHAQAQFGPTPGANDSALNVFIPQTGNTNIMTINTTLMKRLFVICTVAGQTLDAFNVLASTGNSITTQATLATIGTDYTTPLAPMIRASGNLTTQAVGTGWFIMDVGGLDRVVVQASSGNAAGSTISCWSSGS